MKSSRIFAGEDMETGRTENHVMHDLRACLQKVISKTIVKSTLRDDFDCHCEHSSSHFAGT